MAQLTMFSVISFWKLVIKQVHNRPGFNMQPDLSCRALLEGGWQELLLNPIHMIAVAGSDPFDLLLLAQPKRMDYL